MKQYVSFFKMSLMKGLQYRIAALAGMSTQFFFGFIFIMVFKAFYDSGIKADITLHQLVQTVWLNQSFLLFIMLWYRDGEIFNMITSGNIAYELCRPTNLYNHWYARLIGQRISGAMLRFLPILVVAFFLPYPYNLVVPSDFMTFILFLVTLILGLILLVAISMFLYISVFYTLSPLGSTLIFAVFGEFFGGLTIPIPLMPKWLQVVSYLLPFRYSSDLPFRIYAGHIDHGEAMVSILFQLFWIFLLVSLGQVWMKSALKKVVVQGG
ncbi:ABC transporter permease [Acidaminobacter sp. JC074]|uniref:ABC transporter permease n=1 Tax=Acidaminobacter sp. JC074 TaxID=2530199 RepID=UPI001F0F9095|nr:ABC transporter permease [Acidaminobacter sp. JC074]MCH4887252.1 ABC transporter permease [Acidaminobacter sp. JC074]